MKKRLSFICFIVILCYLVVGCGHKSTKELSDVEQFKCQDMIDTVFEYFGETDIKSSYGNEYYSYGDLNLWGYTGEVVFEVRGDKKTIQEFYCHLTLYQKEFEKLLEYFSDKYGSYEVSNYGETVKTYKWKITDKKAEELGYNSVHIQCNTDKKYTVYFVDEWSYENDEAYYKHLEELKENELQVLSKKSYNIREDTFDFIFGEDNNGYNFSLICKIQDKSDAFYTHISLNAIMKSSDDNIKMFLDNFNFSYCIFIGDGTFLMRTKDLLWIVPEDGNPIDVDEYFSTEWFANEANLESDYGTQVVNFLTDFIKNE